MKTFTHLDEYGQVQMVDVGSKTIQQRYAHASGIIYLEPNTIELIKNDGVKKGNVLTIAKIAGIQAAKQTSNLIPLCHPLVLDKIDLKFTALNDYIKAESFVKCRAKTGAEMEALTAVNIALLTIYDMCKAVDKNMQISEIKLIEKVKQNVK